MDESIYKRLEERMEAKKALQPKLYDFETEFRINIVAENDEDAALKVEQLANFLLTIGDIKKAEGNLK